MHRLIRSGSFVIALVVVFAFGAWAQEPPQDMQKMMQEHMKFGAPVAEHQKLAVLAGEWISVSKMWRGPDAPPTETPPGLHVGEMILGGRFLHFTETSDMMGMPMEGWGIMGFNKLRGEYEMIWIDNTATPMYYASGKADSTGNVITLLGKADDPMSGKRDEDVKYIYRFPNDTTVIFEMWDSSGPGKFYKSMETTYSRKP